MDAVPKGNNVLLNDTVDRSKRSFETVGSGNKYMVEQEIVHALKMLAKSFHVTKIFIHKND